MIAAAALGLESSAAVASVVGATACPAAATVAAAAAAAAAAAGMIPLLFLDTKEGARLKTQKDEETFIFVDLMQELEVSNLRI